MATRGFSSNRTAPGVMLIIAWYVLLLSLGIAIIQGLRK
jgi:hypothetical protein